MKKILENIWSVIKQLCVLTVGLGGFLLLLLCSLSIWATYSNILGIICFVVLCIGCDNFDKITNKKQK